MIRAMEKVRNLVPNRKVDREAAGLARDGLVLYVSPGCPFCVRVQLAIAQLGLSIERRNTLFSPGARRELIEGGGSGMVPCLRIRDDAGTRWMYESEDIVRYLKNIAGSAGSER